MALRPAVPGLLKFEIFYDRGGEVLMNVIHVLHAGGSPVPLANVEAGYDEIVAWANASWKTQAVPSASMRMVKAYDMGTVPVTPHVRRALQPFIFGTAVEGNMMPNTVTAAMSLRTGASGTATKPLHGRLYHVGLSFQLVSGPNTYGSQVLVPIYEALRARFNGAGIKGTLVVPSWRSGGAWRAVPVTAPVTHVLGTNTIANMRSRRPRQAAFNVN